MIVLPMSIDVYDGF